MSDSEPTLYCYNHPQTATQLRCNRCERPICTKCAVLTPTGYRCKECVRGQQKVFETALPLDYLLIFASVAVLSYLGSLVAYRIGFFLILLAPLMGGVIAEAARFVTRRRRSKSLYITGAAAAVAGCIPIFLILLLNSSLYGLLWHGLYTALMTSAFYYRLSGIKIGI